MNSLGGVLELSSGTPRRFGLSLFFCLLLVFGFGCAPDEQRADLVFINGAEPESLDPAMVTGQAELRIISGLFEGLTRFNAVTGEAEPGLAHRWEISENGLDYTFFLRSNLVWSTGEPITANDFRYSWLRALAPSNAAAYAGQLFPIKNAEPFSQGKVTDGDAVGIRVRSPHILEVQLEQFTPYFIELCAFQTLAVVPRHSIEKYGDRWLLSAPVPVSGAFLLDAWRINDKVRLRRNPRYWDASNTQSELIDILPVGSASTALNLYEGGSADVVWDKDLVPVELMETLQTRPDFHSFDNLGTYFFRFNTTRVPFTDARVRRALAMAVNKPHIMEKIVKSGGRLAKHLTPPVAKNFLPPQVIEFNPGEARRLLAEAGYPGGKGFPRFHYLFNAAAGGGGANMHERIAVELQAMWQKELGIEMDLRRIESKIFYSTQDNLDFDLSRSSWVGDYNDPMTFLNLFLSNSGNNRTGWTNAAYDRLIRDADREPNQAKRSGMLRDAETMLVRDEVPIVPIYFYRGVNYFDTNKVAGIYFNILDNHPLHTIKRIDRDRRSVRR